MSRKLVIPGRTHASCSSFEAVRIQSEVNIHYADGNDNIILSSHIDTNGDCNPEENTALVLKKILQQARFCQDFVNGRIAPSSGE